MLLGYIGADFFLGGDFELDAGKARAAIAELAEVSASTSERCAWASTISSTDHGGSGRPCTRPTIGVDPSTLPVIAFGGAGPVHAYGVARKLNAKKVVCPAGAGVTSAVGLLIAPVAADVSPACRCGLDRWDAAAVRDVFAQAREGRPRGVLQAEVDADGISYARTPSICAMSARATRSA